MIREILVALDAWHDWWIAFWWDNPVLFVVMVLLSLALAWYRHGRKS